MAALRKRGKHWYLYYRDKGRIVEKSLGTEDKAEADRNASAIMVQMRYARHMRMVSDMMKRFTISAEDTSGPTVRLPDAQHEPCPASFVIRAREDERKPVSNQGRLLLKDVWKTALLHRPSLSRRHMETWNAFLSECNVKYADEVTPKEALAYMERRCANSKPKTYNNIMGMLNIVFKSVLVEAGLDSSPFEPIIPRKMSDSVEHYRNFTIDECARIIRAACPHWQTLCMISYYTGLRLESCRRLSPSHIKDGVITIMPGKTARFGRAVQIPLHDGLRKYLDSLPECNDDALPYCDRFPKVTKWPKSQTPDGKAYQVSYFDGLLDSLGIGERNGEKVGFHSFRCTFITEMSARNVSERALRGMVGHTRQEMTDLYNHDVNLARDAMENTALPSPIDATDANKNGHENVK